MRHTFVNRTCSYLLSLVIFILFVVAKSHHTCSPFFCLPLGGATRVLSCRCLKDFKHPHGLVAAHSSGAGL